MLDYVLPSLPYDPPLQNMFFLAVVVVAVAADYCCFCCCCCCCCWWWCCFCWCYYYCLKKTKSVLIPFLLLHDITRCVLANYYSSFSSFSPFSSFTSWYILNLFFSSTATTYITGCSTIDFPVNISRNVFFPSFKS